MFKTDLSGVEHPLHPGEVLREDYFQRLDLSLKELARHLQVPEQVLSNLVAELQPVTLDLAQRLSEAFGPPARYWLALQMQYDLYRATQSGPVGIPSIWASNRRLRSSGRKSAL